MHTTAPALTRVSVDSHRIALRSASATTPRVDAGAGAIRGVSLLSGDREARGHGMWCDQRTLSTFHALLSGKRLKAYATHGAWSKDGTLDEIGYWESAVIDGKNLRADFVALDSWKKHNAPEFDKLFEMAEKLPTEFGASLSFSFALAWQMPGGVETATRRKWSAAGWAFDPVKPAGALRDMPSVRATVVYSADFVDQPAANDGLFHAGPAAPGSAAPTAAALRAQLQAVKGDDAASAKRRGQIVAQIKALGAQ